MRVHSSRLGRRFIALLGASAAALTSAAHGVVLAQHRTDGGAPLIHVG